jgi:hypothetical protein
MRNLTLLHHISLGQKPVSCKQHENPTHQQVILRKTTAMRPVGIQTTCRVAREPYVYNATSRLNRQNDRTPSTMEQACY